MVNKLYGFGIEIFEIEFSVVIIYISLVLILCYFDGVVRGSKIRVIKSFMMKKKVVGLRFEIEKMFV